MIDAKQSNDATFIVIHGMGGIGKTTLAKVLYNEFSNCFESCSFVPNIREASSNYKGMENLQKQIVSDILIDKSLHEISHVDEGITIIEKSFKGKRLLLLLDDVGNKDQLNKLAGKNNWFGSDSIIIVTTKNRDVTVASGHNLSYELTKLNDDQSYELFYKHAFGRDAPCPSDLEFIARDIILMTGGLPLALEVIGSLLCGKSKGFWEATLEKLRKKLDDTVGERLKISYDSLTYEQQQIFLDIACLQICKFEFASYMWRSYDFYPEEGIGSLVSLSLIKIEYGNMLTMHDQLRDLGRKIVHEEGRYNIGNCSRIWEDEKAPEMIEQKQGTPNVQALILRPPYYPNSAIYYTSEQFEGMTNLRFLKMGDVRLIGDFENRFPNLKWLQWSSLLATDFDIMGINLNPKKLVILELESVNITEHWNCWSEMKYLKVLKLQYCCSLTTTPDFSALEGLEVLILHSCLSLTRIHPSIGKFSKTLKVLDVHACRELEELPIEVGKMEELRELVLDYASIREIPIFEGYMTKLEILSANFCKRLTYIPDSLSSLVKLQCLRLRLSQSLTRIPHSIGKLKLLTKLDLSFTRVRELPASIRELYNLESLNMHSTPINCLPTSIGTLTKLQRLDLRECRELESLPNLPSSLPSLAFHGDSMEILPDFSNLTNLNVLTYEDSFERRNKALNLGNLNQLKILHIRHTNVHRHLKIFFSKGKVKFSNPVEEIDLAPKNFGLQLELPVSLVELEVHRCQTLRNFPSLSNMRNLSKISLRDCYALMEINGLEGAESLAHLEIRNCRKLSKIGDLSYLRMLKTLSLCDCEKLTKIQGLENLTSLRSLDLTGTPIFSNR